MRLLLDTSVVIWSLSDPDRLSSSVYKLIESPENEAFFSQFSLMEMAIKSSLGKLDLDVEIEDVPQALEQCGFDMLRLSNAAIFAWLRLPPIHRDPFDRFLICEAIEASAAFVTPDKTCRSYPVKTVW